MSLDCYPFGKRRTIDLKEQPLALDVAYNDNLFVSTTDECRSIVVYDLSTTADEGILVRKISLNDDVVIDQIIYCNTGDYLAFVGHKNGILLVYTVFEWRQNDSNPQISTLNLNAQSTTVDRREKLNSIDCCQRTGNIAISCGDTILIYKYIEDVPLKDEDTDSFHSKAETVKEFGQEEVNCEDSVVKQHFEHIINIKLTIWAQKICLLENYLSITTADHVQVLKLELLTLQIQSDGPEAEFEAETNVLNGKINSQLNDNNNFNEVQSETTSTTSTTAATTTTCSMISDSNSTTTNFSSFNNTNGIINEHLNNSDISIITLNNQQQQYDLESDVNGVGGADSNQSADDCITWNLNTKKLVKLPTLMHNTSTNLSSYHICHPLELLGPASESIACRVSASIYLSNFCQNQLEAVVMLCKQFDLEKEPAKSTNLQAVYLNSQEDLKRLNKSAMATLDHQTDHCGTNQTNQPFEVQAGSNSMNRELLKSKDHDLLVSVTCFISTLTNCFVYSLNGKKVVRTQTITNPDICLDLRPDLLNVYVLTPLGLQICSSGICDSTFRYDWSSSSDLNLSFIATNRARILTTSSFIIMLECSASGRCVVEYMEKPDLISLYDRIVHTVNRCNSISIRSNMLTYLHATAQLSLIARSLSPRSSQVDDCSRRETFNILKTATIMLCKQLLQKKQTNVITNGRIDKAIKHLLEISMCDLGELMRRHWQALCLQQDNSIYIRSSDEIESDFESSNDNNIRHQLRDEYDREESSFSERRMINYESQQADDEQPIDTDYELIKIYLKYAKFSQSLLDYLVQNSRDEAFSSKIIDYMFEHNPRLLIKCAQRYPLKDDDINQPICVQLLVEKLKQLAEFDSTGINRATVLFTLAILYNALDDKQKCLASLSQIKPLNHLAITMCSNYELCRSIASVVNEHYPDVFNLFLIQLAKKDKSASQEYSVIYRNSNNLSALKEEEEDSFKPSNLSWHSKSRQLKRIYPEGSSDHEEHFDNEGNYEFNYGKELDCDDEDADAEEDEQEIYERKLKILSEIPAIELIELLTVKENDESEEEKADKLACRAYLEASINLLESQFILARLRDNSH